MTRIFRNISLLLLVLISSTSCFKDSFGSEQIEEGVPTEVSIDFDVLASSVVTRAAQDTEYEFRVHNLYIYVFDNDGAVLYRHFFNEEGSGTDKYGNPVNMSFDNPSSADRGTISFKTVTAIDAKIVAVANVTETGVTETNYTLTEAMLDDVSSYSALQELVMVGQSSIFRGGLFMMTGVARNSDDTEDIDITTSGTPLNCVIQLDRSDAKVEFRIQTGTPAPNISYLSFAPNQWRVLRVPKESMVMPKAGNYNSNGILISDADVAAGASYFNTEWTPFEIKSSTSQPINGFTFYMPENRQMPREIINGDDIAAVKLREEQLHENLSQDQIDNSTRPGHTFNNTEFKYAGLDATYVEFSGTLSYIETVAGVSTHVSVLAHFTVHLGQVGSSGAYTPNDYETKRNTHYIYNVRLNGANDIEVEVKGSTPGNENELTPGYEGEVVKNSNYVYELDSHFERRVLAVDRNMIDEEMTWGVSTLYSQGIHDYSSAKVETDLRDYKWVKFAINYEHGAAANRFVDYPGNQNYYDPDAAVGLVVGGRVYPEGYSSTAVSTKPLYDVDQLVKRLKEIKGNSAYFDSNDRVWVTAFIDEYVYYKHPITYLNQAGNKTQSMYQSFWRNTTNSQERLLHFITTDAKYSPDGESSVVNTVFTFKQKSIKSLYNINKDYSAIWGIENLQEGERMPVTPSESGNSNLYNSNVYNLSSSLEAGRHNTMRWWNYQNNPLVFNNVIDNNATVTVDGVTSPDPYAYRSNYEYVPYACLNRNRDENGNGRIDESEVRWYLASIRNLCDFFIGQYCFDQSEFLYPGASVAISRNQSEGNNTRLNNGYFYNNQNIAWHYGTSTIKGSECDIFWAEEGCATGSYGWSSGSSYGGIGINLYAYRCVRDLGVHYEQTSSMEPDHLYEPPVTTSNVTVSGETYRVKTVDLSHYNPTSLRTNFETVSLPDHTESGSVVIGGQTISEGGNSRPYSKFQFIVNNDGSGRNFNISGEREWAFYQANDPCPDGWRMPNIRELAVMAMIEPGNGWQSFATTRFSLQQYYTSKSNVSDRPSYEFQNSNLSTELGSDIGTRCVRDFNGS